MSAIIEEKKGTIVSEDSALGQKNGVEFVASAVDGDSEKMMTIPDGTATDIDPVAEQRLRRKIDVFVVPIVALLYLFCFLDRSNIGNARLAGLEADLGMHGSDYNAVTSIFFVSYTIFGIPATVACRRIGPGWYLPVTTLCFGLASLCMAFAQTRAQAAALRFVLGICEAGVMPGIAYYLAGWYRRRELALRLSLYVVMAPLSGAFGGLLASAILRLHSVGAIHSWRMIFVVEGVMTAGAAVVALATLADRPATARWLTPAERELAERRIRADRGYHGRDGRQGTDESTKDNARHLEWPRLWRGIASPATLSTAAMFFCSNITIGGLGLFLPTIIRSIFPDRPTTVQQLYTVPPYAVGAVVTVLISFWSDRVDRRQIFMLAAAVPVMAGYAVFLATSPDSATARYAATFLIAGSAFVLGTMSSAQVSANVVSDSARSSALATNVVLGSLGGLVSTWSFLAWDAPRYRIGNSLNLAASTAMLLLGALTLFWMRMSNRRRQRRNAASLAALEGLSEQEIKNLDWKHPSFRWRP